MLEKNQTRLEKFGFGDSPKDTFYCLMDGTRNAGGIDLKKLSAASPAKLDEVMEQMGCIVIITEKDAVRIAGKKNFTSDDLHEKLYEMGRDEGLI